MLILSWLQQVRPNPNFRGNNFRDCHKNGSENYCSTAMLRRVHDSFGQILVFLIFLHSRWVQEKKIWERKKGEIETTKKVFKLTHDWAKLTANWAPMQRITISKDTSWIFCINTDLLCNIQQVYIGSTSTEAPWNPFQVTHNSVLNVKGFTTLWIQTWLDSMTLKVFSKVNDSMILGLSSWMGK